jgi:GT2 family glycosyltransferase
MADPTRHHGLLLTFRRPVEFADHLTRLAAQDAGLDTLLVVDNDNDPAIRKIMDAHPDAAGESRYLGIDGNPGPAGGIAAGIEEILAQSEGGDWLVLLDDDDPPATDNTFAMLRETIASLDDPRIGGVGVWGARVRPTGRLRVDTSAIAAAVDYLPGSACVHYRIDALRECEGHDPDMFFGFDDLDLGLSLRRAGWNLYSSGQARLHGLAHMVEGRTTTKAVASPSWRRYYSLRNLITTLRRDGRLVGAVVMTLSGGLAKPVVNLVIRPRLAWRSLRQNLRAIRDGWSGTTGKTVDPLDPPSWLK